MESSLLEHPSTKSNNFLDTANYPYDPMTFTEYIQYPQSPYNSGSLNLPATMPSPSLPFDGLSLSGGMEPSYYSSSSSYTTASPARPFTPNEGVSPPALYTLSGAELSSEALHSDKSSRRNSGSHSPAHLAGALPFQTIPRSHRFNPLGTASSSSTGSVSRSSTRGSAARRRSLRNEDSDDDDDDFAPSSLTNDNASVGGGNSVDGRRETIRKQRIESEQRRRDELRDGYRRLKEALPISNQKSSKVSLLERATTYIRTVDTTLKKLQEDLEAQTKEVDRLRRVNETLMLSAARHGVAVAAQQQQQQAGF